MSAAEATPTKPEQPLVRSRWRWNSAGLAVALIAIIAALFFWVNSKQFEDTMRRRLAVQLQSATGGRVEIGSFHWHLFDLDAEANGVIIHGDEAPSDAPYAQVDHLHVRLSLLGFWSPRILLRDLEIVRPRFHLIIYPDGATNQPHPAKPKKQKQSAAETLFDLEAGRLEVEQGMLDIDNRATAFDFQDRYQPLDFKADHVSLLAQYVAASGVNPESYRAQVT